MLKNILISSTILFSSISPAFAGPPGATLSSVFTPYGTFSCIQRAKTKLFSLNATGINVSADAVWGFVDDSTVGIWCRGSEAIITVAGGNNFSSLRDEVKTAF